MSYLRVVEQQFDHGVTLPQEEAPVAKPKEVDSIKGEGAVLNFGLEISEYLGCWMYLELGNP